MIDDRRSDPDALLRQAADEKLRSNRGKLTIFFGAAPGVGKTYAMLEVARAEMEQEKRDVVVGIAETHGRYETAALMLGLELLPRRKVPCRGVEIEEFDLDGALHRHPDLVLIDELAHTNVEGSRHPKRWQDVEDLLDAGIDVFATMNVQHVESLNDVIAKVTGVVVRETVPDSVLERAHELKLVDLPPDDLLERLREGKVYVPAQAQRAIENFFRKGNLIALRELALRRTAEHVDAQMRAFRRAQGIEQTWAIAEQVIVAVSPSPYSARLIRAARRMAGALHARWFAVFVEQPSARRLPESVRSRLEQNLRLAQQLGAEVVTLSGDNASDELLRFARERSITKIIVGKPTMQRWRDRFRVSLVDEMVRKGGDIEVYVTAGDRGPEETAPEKQSRRPAQASNLVFAGAACALSTAIAFLLFGREQLPDVVMTYLLGIILIASRYGFAASVLTAFLSVAALNFFFVPPFLTFRVANFQHAVTFAVMFLVAIVISGLTQRLKNQAAAARQREERTLALYELSRELAGAEGKQSVVEIAASHLAKVFASQIALFVPGSGGALTCAQRSAGLGEPTEHDVGVAKWVWSHRRDAGMGTTTLPSGRWLYVPLAASTRMLGVLGLCPEQPNRFESIDQRRQLDVFAAQVAVALERTELSEQTDRARREVETEQLRSTLLSSVSHDLRTPLAVITGAASTLTEGGPSMPDSSRQDLTKTILEEAERLNRLIRNLLDMTRLESGTVQIKKEWVPLEEAVGAALNRMDARLADRQVRVELPPELPLLAFDPVLLEQVFINLLENAARYSTGAIEIRAVLAPPEVTIEIADHGPGIAAGEETRIFEKFQRAAQTPGGVGLGLPICRAIVAAHGGRIWAENRMGGGAAFCFTLPIDEAPPEVVPHELSEATLLDARHE